MLFSEPLRLESSSDSHPVYSAPVRPGVTFFDGTEVTADRVAESLADSRLFNEHAEAESRGDRVVFRLKRPNARFDLVLTQRFASVMLRRGTELLGTGPFLPAPDSRPDRVRLVRNPRYRHPVDLDELIFSTYPLDADGRPRALLDALAAGEVDFTSVLSREDMGTVRGMRKWLEPGSATAILYFNTEHEALRDPRLRRALAAAIDRKAIAQTTYPNPLTFTATSLLPPLMGRWNDGISHDLATARRLLAEPGVPKPERLSLLLIYGPRPYLPNPRAVADELARQIGELGIAIEVTPTASSEQYYSTIARGDYDMVLAGWIADTSDPADYLEAVLSPEAVPSPRQPIVVHANLSRWANGEMTEALHRFRAESSDSARDTIRDLISREVPLLPVMYGPTTYVYTPRLQGFEPSSLGVPLLYTAKLE
jgi:ABC-type transport system substrate-binding protein